MNAKQYQKLPAGTKVQVDMGGDTAIGIVVKALEHTSRKMFYASRVQITEAHPESRWAKYVGKPSQDFHFAFVAGVVS